MSPVLQLILTVEAALAAAALVGLELSLIIYILVEARQKWRMQTRKLKAVRGRYQYTRASADIWQHRQDRRELV